MMDALAPRILLVNFETDADSPALAWQHQVVRALAAQGARLTVLTEKVGAGKLPADVEVHRIPGWYARAPQRWFGAKWLANILVYRLCRRHAFNACFVHMSMEWAYRLYPCLRWFRIPILLWYAHGTVTWRLRLAHRCAERVVTSSAGGFRITSSKLRIIGQGIDTRLFTPPPVQPRKNGLITVGRVSERKRVHLMIKVVAELKRLRPQVPISLSIVGSPLTRRDRRYREKLDSAILEQGLQDRIAFLGHVPLRQLPRVYARADAMLNLSDTGSMDKAVLEALACGCPAFTTNAAFDELFRRHALADLLLQRDSPSAIARRILEHYERPPPWSGRQLRAAVAEQDLDGYARRVLDEIEELTHTGAARVSAAFEADYR